MDACNESKMNIGLKEKEALELKKTMLLKNEEIK